MAEVQALRATWGRGREDRAVRRRSAQVSARADF